MKFNIKVDKEDLKVYAKTAGRVGKAVVVEGTKALVLKAATKAIKATFDGDFDAVKNLTLDDVIGKPKEAKPKKVWFGKKDKKEEVVELEEVEVVEVPAEDVLIEAETVIIEAK